MHNLTTHTKREWQSPHLFDLAHFEVTQGSRDPKGLSAPVEIHCTTTAFTPSTYIYNPTTSGAPQSGPCIE